MFKKKSGKRKPPLVLTEKQRAERRGHQAMRAIAAGRNVEKNRARLTRLYGEPKP